LRATRQQLAEVAAFTTAGTSHTAANLCKISDEIRPPFWQTARCALGGEGTAKKYFEYFTNCQVAANQKFCRSF